MMMLESRPDDTEASRYSLRQMTRISKIDVFSQLEPFAKLRNRIRFSKFQMLYMDHFSMPFTKMQSKLDFVKFHFLRFFNGSPDSGQEKKSPLIRCQQYDRDNPAGQSAGSAVQLSVAGGRVAPPPRPDSIRRALRPHGNNRAK